MPKEIKNAQHFLNEPLAKERDLSNKSSLTANAVKTNYNVYSPKRLYNYHQLMEEDIDIFLGSTGLKLDKESRYLVIYLAGT